ncbi:TetR/AcrR family transcriptional regulator [Gloeocapsopsis dulcis]|uniref:TetR family transcriptional regulator n=1 Tax=Gloeocapsopsis dulcis AAB1 = 1H9 TaxID=1433147 RepID=A0A6N8FTP9_9CHRO|nr:TetR/AcrR family transcriptional regulator [Gloeocapsopsis dulcis]MUL36321.1 TetR family transcriptional regulator [Gloeocapsopsis dulcis AAB1 = 1H9]WNN89569.1 TetR/AcrR family transcriptional regulator [Gloeocapsopsis dulcis]
MSRGPKKQFNPEVALAKAMDVFWARGYEAASLSELLEHMGIGKKSLYDTFGNKRSLFLKALDYYAQTEVKAMRDQLLASGSPLANLEQVLQNLQQRHSLPRSRGCMLGTNIADFDTDDTEIALILYHHLQRLEDAYCTVIDRAQKAGEISSAINSRNVARMLLCTTQGMALLGRVVEDETLLRSTVEATVMLLKMV